MDGTTLETPTSQEFDGGVMSAPDVDRTVGRRPGRKGDRVRIGVAAGSPRHAFTEKPRARG